MSSEKNSELSELTSEKNSEFRIKVGNYHPYSENIVRFGNYSKVARRKFRINFATFGAISEPHSKKNFRTISEKNPQATFVKSFRTTFGQKFCIKFFIHKFP